VAVIRSPVPGISSSAAPLSGGPRGSQRRGCLGVCLASSHSVRVPGPPVQYSRRPREPGSRHLPGCRGRHGDCSCRLHARKERRAAEESSQLNHVPASAPFPLAPPVDAEPAVQASARSGGPAAHRPPVLRPRPLPARPAGPCRLSRFRARPRGLPLSLRVKPKWG
jgi:hypothetical protein